MGTGARSRFVCDSQLVIPVCVDTSDYVLDEVVTLLFKREVFQKAVSFVEASLEQ